MGFFDEIKEGAKKKWKEHQAEERRKGSIYREEYKKAEISEIKAKARREARAEYRPSKSRSSGMGGLQGYDMLGGFGPSQGSSSQRKHRPKRKRKKNRSRGGRTVTIRY